VTLTASLLLFAIFWRRRSVAILPLVMLFPWAASHAIMTVSGLAQGIDDYNHVIDMTGWPSWPFFALFSILAVVGVLLFGSCLPLLGLRSTDKRIFFVIPGGLLLWALVSLMAAHVTVPGSRADAQFGIREEFMSSASDGVLVALFMGVLLALGCFTFYRVIERKLPTYLRTETRDLAWRDLSIPGTLSLLCIVVGVLIIR